MHKRKKWVPAILAAVVLTGTLVACSNGGGNNGSSNESNGESSTQTSEAKLNIVNGKIEPPVTITMIRAEDPTVKFKNGETYSDNVHTHWANETLGVNIETLWSSPSADTSYDTKLKLMLSSGDKLPDVFVSSQPNTTNMFLESGKVLDVTEAFEKYASETYKSAMNEVPEAWQPFMMNGKKLALPVLRPTMGTQSPLWIRQDWLDKLGLKEPTNLEELEHVMDAFVNKDPDGNGKKDTYALDFGMKDTFTGYPVGDASWIFGMFGAIPERWYPDSDGKLQYGSTQPGIKAALEKIAEWKSKGYIAQDIALHDFNKVAENVASVKVGMLGGENWVMVYPGSMMLASNPTAMYTPYPLPKGIDGKNMRTVASLYTNAILISKDISKEALLAFFHYQNSLYESYNSEDPFLFKGFQEGYDYVIKDGKAVMDEKQIPGGKVATMKYTISGSQTVYTSKLLESTLKRAKGETLENKDLAAFATSAIFSTDSNPLEKITDQATLVIAAQTDSDVREYFQGPATSTMSTRNELLKKMQMDTFTDIIYSKQPAGAFDDFVKKWKSSGGDKITDEVNDWYDSVKEVK
ncbi:extracellular solute-binding protein [Paenibacillus sp. UASWS1643]|uniref:extracellular solute-binding protein n=1 Tax=Paenibacillus sp. UASWS1643 TaxID=2580422 RepID=UPI00123B3EB6|nr:extracellular solute-binding protein [Paenibacillus sp. UASWS1643]KAA8746130.1 extracellular solute-binding protein [Paenibacillus sp. UASWS1643]